MPLRLDVKRVLTARSDRVKCVDQHPSEPWMLVALYNGNVHVWNIDSQQLVKSFEVCDVPVRAAKFVARKNWVVTGSDDMMVRVYNYNTLERSHQFEAHSDYVRSIVVHPTQPFVLTSSDDMLIKLWNWDSKWTCQQVFEGHTHYVMQIVINPKDNNTFASASLDRTVKIWQLGSPTANFTLEGHQRGVNSVDYSHGGDKPYLISGADDCMVKIWDYQNKTCVQTLDGHSQNISSVLFHPSLPILVTGSEDCTLKIWHANTYRLQNTLNYGLDRVWCIAAQKASNNVCIGYDEGAVIVKLGREEPAMSMDISGKMVFARHSEMQQANLKATADVTTDIRDGERLPLAVKDMGACDIYPQTIKHNPNGRFVVVCGDGEYIIYTAMALRNKAFGPALEFVWGLDSSEYAIRESNYVIKFFKNFKEKNTFKPDFGCESMFGGQLLGCGSSATGLAFYDWETQELVRRIEIQAKQVFWAESGQYVAIATEENYFVLKYNAEAVAKARETKEGVTDDGIEDAFDLLEEVSEVVKTGQWVGDCFIYTNSVNRLNYYVGGEIVTIAHLDRTLYLLGYIAKDNRVYLGDKELAVVSYELHLSVLDYQTAVMRRDFETADRVLPTVPLDQRTRVAQFLEKQGFARQALQVTQDSEHKFSLAVSLGELSECVALAGSDNKKWLVCGQLAQKSGDLDTARTCLLKAKDYPGLLLQASAAGDADLVKEVGQLSAFEGHNNVAFLSLFITGQLQSCLDLLITTNRIPEAALFARSYLPSAVPRVLKLWREAAGENIGPSLADPKTYDNLFPDLKTGLKAEKFVKDCCSTPVAAASYCTLTSNAERNLQQEMEDAEAAGLFSVNDAELGFMDDDDDQDETVEDNKDTARGNDDEEAFHAEGEHALRPDVEQQATGWTNDDAPDILTYKKDKFSEDDDWPRRKMNEDLLVDVGESSFVPEAVAQAFAFEPSSLQAPSVNMDQLELELELDVENLNLEDNGDGQDVNLIDDEELLAD